ncbi:MAG: hypothetical protein AAFY03_05915, partial [Pseudomonadota bacterium]
VFARSQLIDAISHFSARTFGYPAMPLDGLGTGLKADYALSGQCRLADSTVTVDLVLFDVASQTAIWSGKEQISLQSFLAGDSGLAEQVVSNVLFLIMARSARSSISRPLPELSAHRLMLAAVSLMHAFESPHFDRARDFLLEVSRRCPDHSLPRAWLAQWHLLRVFQKWSEDPKTDAASARGEAAAALDLNPTCAHSLAIDGNINTVIDADFSVAESRFSDAQAINPSSATINHLASVLAIFQGRGAEAVRLTERGQTLSPRDPRRPFFQALAAGSYVAGGQYEKAVAMADGAIRHNPMHLSAHRARVIALQLGGRGAQAREACAKLLSIDPRLTVSDYLRNHPAGATEMGQNWGFALKEAGVPVN